MKKDIRADLEAIAKGKPVQASRGPVIDEAIVKSRQADFRAWHAFVTPVEGEPLTAPAELLTPLP